MGITYYKLTCSRCSVLLVRLIIRLLKIYCIWLLSMRSMKYGRRNGTAIFIKKKTRSVMGVAFEVKKLFAYKLRRWKFEADWSPSILNLFNLWRGFDFSWFFGVFQSFWIIFWMFFGEGMVLFFRILVMKLVLSEPNCLRQQLWMATLVWMLVLMVLVFCCLDS